MKTENENILVLIQMIGGNDGLNTLVPLNSYEELVLHRKNILIPEDKLIKSGSDIGFHPATKQLKQLFNEEQMCVVNDIGYPQPNRSHFRSMDIWNSGSPSDQQWNSGWLGRWMDLYHSKFPEGYPNANNPDPLAVTIGNIVSDTCQGKAFNYSHVVDNLHSFTEINKCEVSAIQNKQYNHLLKFLNSNITLANLYTKQIEKAASKGKSVAAYPDKNSLAQELKVVSRLIHGGLKTKIYVLSCGGFDTHAYQGGKNNPLDGMHSYLLKSFSEAIGAFTKDLKALHIYNKVCIMTYSEFGRQIKSNSAFGTDHGDATSIYLFGNNFNLKLIGQMPLIPKEVAQQQALEMKIDFRDFYASLLQEWLSVPFKDSEEIFKIKPKPYSIFKS